MNMKKIVALAVILVALVACQQEGGVVKEKKSLGTKKDQVSYAMGLDMGANLMRMGIDLDMDAFVQGLRDTLSAKNGLMSMDSAKSLLLAWSQEKQKEMQEKQRQEAEENMKAGLAFLEKNKTAEGVQVTASGLQYKVLTEGQGDAPQLTDKVKVHYTGTNMKGEEFDSSYKRKKPLEMVVGQVIPGWQEALKMMKPGAKWKIWIPAALGYGARRMSDKLGPNEVLTFEMELLEVLPKDTTAANVPGLQKALQIDAGAPAKK
jgi:FKBP-type peptidyl-prolyl cis-trans isomerase